MTHQYQTFFTHYSHDDAEGNDATLDKAVEEAREAIDSDYAETYVIYECIPRTIVARGSIVVRAIRDQAAPAAPKKRKK